MYSIPPVWTNKRQALAISKCYGGGASTTNPTIPPEFLPLIKGAVARMTQQQGLNPIDSYNAPNPMGVEGMTPGQDAAMGASAGNLFGRSPLTAVALQAAQRAAGMAGAGPTTGHYNPSGEMGLQDWMQVTRPYQGTGGEMGTQDPPNGSGGPPFPVPPRNPQGNMPNLSQAPPGAVKNA